MWLPFATLLLATAALSADVSRFTNIECKMLDPSYVTFEQCDLKILGRGIVGLNIYGRLNKGPVDNIKINMSLWRKFNGYRPFIVNSTFDLCSFMAKPIKKMSFEKIFMDLMHNDSNLNHTCPYENAIIVRNMIFKEEYMKFAPLPRGHYKFQLKLATNNDWKAIINTHILHNAE